ncbi:hypothetical protein J2S40_004477 [Nocardioides luteus]|uniref:DUF4410 domain-containing protein n=1 Tax=Nocardioides luteus TaxID=1844 RepID=A0ABQ5SR18_9ACTN|nr:hypothetical protein [Nocardioides luteus]MDR7313419.1 hypothetical protein [Nocardioides luteus]GGR60781.1 hypothetical protein GCM10010197_29840 [Nocardioides luteus]GLJ66485.1 hypothetical protein GCM10017579_05210 [Nocardioides luteus]
MSTNKEQSFIAENGITLGIIALALFVVLGVGLPRWVGDSESHSGVKITLPATLSGGLKSADEKSSYDLDAIKKQGATEEQLDQFIKQNAIGAKTEDRNVSDALGFSMASRTYITKDMKKSVLIRAFAGDGSAYYGGGEVSKVRDNICYSSSDQQTGQTQATCSHASNDLTVQATAMSKKEAAKYADEIFEKLA